MQSVSINVVSYFGAVNLLLNVSLSASFEKADKILKKTND